MKDEARAPGYTLFDHTADLGVEVTAPTLGTLFETAAAAMFDLLAGTRPGAAPADRLTREVTVAGADREELLVRWLSDLLYLHDTEGILFREFHVTGIEDGRLTGWAAGEIYDPSRHLHRSGIKAVTYHQVLVRLDEGRWTARIVLDV